VEKLATTDQSRRYITDISAGKPSLTFSVSHLADTNLTLALFLLAVRNYHYQ